MLHEIMTVHQWWFVLSGLEPLPVIVKPAQYLFAKQSQAAPR